MDQNKIKMKNNEIWKLHFQNLFEYQYKLVINIELINIY